MIYLPIDVKERTKSGKYVLGSFGKICQSNAPQSEASVMLRLKVLSKLTTHRRSQAAMPDTYVSNGLKPAKPVREVVLVSRHESTAPDPSSGLAPRHCGRLSLTHHLQETLTVVTLHVIVSLDSGHSYL